ncbi:MAG TPA: hypothetical protein DIT65_06145 [Cryomorphaceae bacterium]|nr:hypothetical protein [Cryomorphaceae bacterium]|tara:strand:+ start:3302 stop:4411 length:1110 start_codon:yes stop_codon:yes gene_type:complete
MSKVWIVLAGLALASCTQEVGALIRFELEQTGSYAVQYRKADGKFSVMDSLEILGDDVFEVAFDTLQMISFLPLEGKLPKVHAVVGPETKELTISKDGYISGDAENNWLGAQLKMQLDLNALIDSLDAIKSTYKDSTTHKGLRALDSMFFENKHSYRKRILDSLIAAPGRLSNLMTVYHRIGQNPVLEYGVDREVLRGVNDALIALAPASNDVLAFNMRVEELEEIYMFTTTVSENAQKFVVGSAFPEFTLETPQGALVSLELMSLDNHIVGIWASWSVECRNQLRTVAKTQSMDNWVLLSVDGLPQQRSPLGEWYEAIVTDGLGGQHLSDLKGSRSVIIETLGVQEMPLYFKVENGIITKRVSRVEDL